MGRLRRQTNSNEFFRVLNNTNEFAAQRAPQRALPRQCVAMEVEAVVRWLVWGFGSWDGLEKLLLIIVGRVGVIVRAWILCFCLCARARRRADFLHRQTLYVLVCVIVWGVINECCGLLQNMM